MRCCSPPAVFGKAWTSRAKRCRIVAIDKLPFAAPDDPLLKARLEGIRRRGGNPFYEYQLPQAVLALKQGVGRLIRDFDDFGVIVIGDPRISTKAYGRVFLDSMPRSPIITDGAVGAQFLAERCRRCARHRRAPRDPLSDACWLWMRQPRPARPRCFATMMLVGRSIEAGKGHAQQLLGMVTELLAEARFPVHARWHRREHRARCVHRGEDQRIRGARAGIRRRTCRWCRSPPWKPWRFRSCERGSARALACLDARMGEVYWGASPMRCRLIAAGAPRVRPATAWRPCRRRQRRRRRGRRCGRARHRPRLFRLSGLASASRVCSWIEQGEPRVAECARRSRASVPCAWTQAADSTPAELQPLYLRDKVALTEAERAAKPVPLSRNCHNRSL